MSGEHIPNPHNKEAKPLAMTRYDQGGKAITVVYFAGKLYSYVEPKPVEK